MELKVEYLPLEAIKPYENNAKLHPEEQIEQIKKSIQEFGMNDPIAIDENGVIIEGHGRYEACLQLGMEKIPAIRLSNLSEEQRKAYALVHNKLTMNTGFDFANLVEDLKFITDIDMQDFGFNNFIMDSEFEDFEPEEFDKEIEEDYPEQGLKSFNVIISCMSEEEKQWLKKILHEPKELHRLYDCKKLMENYEVFA